MIDGRSHAPNGTSHVRVALLHCEITMMCEILPIFGAYFPLKRRQKFVTLAKARHTQKFMTHAH
jgi:hypothetical protein